MERLLREDDVELLGYFGDEIVKLTLDDVDCFFVEDGRGAALAAKTSCKAHRRGEQIKTNVHGTSRQAKP